MQLNSAGSTAGDSPRRVGIVGLGVMGSAMAGRLLAHGVDVIGYDVDSDRMRAHRVRGGSTAPCPADICQDVDVLVTSLPSGAALAAAIEEPRGIATGAHPELVVIETSTLSVSEKQSLAEVLKRVGAEMLDCPLSGTGAQAEAGEAVAYLSGNAGARERAERVMELVMRRVIDAGEFGGGMRLKLAANLLVAVHNVAAAEALLLLERQGVNPIAGLAALQDGAGSSAMLRVRGPLMIQRQYDHVTASVATMIKDVGLIEASLAELELDSPTFRACAEIYRKALCGGRAAEDTACVMSVLDE